MYNKVDEGKTLMELMLETQMLLEQVANNQRIIGDCISELCNDDFVKNLIEGKDNLKGVKEKQGNYTSASTKNEKNVVQDDSNLELRVSKLMDDFGIPAHVLGFSYIRTAIILAVKDPTILNGITKILYPKIARQYSSTPSKVERAIRHAIEISWARGNTKLLDEYFAFSINPAIGKPTNSEFIAKIADRIRLGK